MNTLDPTEGDFGTEVLEREMSEIEAKETQTPARTQPGEELLPTGSESLQLDIPSGGAIAEPGSPDTGAMMELEEGLAIVPRPIQPIPIKRKLSGIYKSSPRPWELVLRPDIDGSRPMNKVSGDFNRSTGSTNSYYGSFVMEAPSVLATSSQVTISGVIRTTWTTSYNRVRIVIPRNSIFQPAAAATVQFFDAYKRPGARYTCFYDSVYFRTVQLEQDYETGVSRFNSYNTGLLPSGGPARTLTVAKAYAEAGIHIQDTGRTNQINSAGAGSDGKWNNAELHFAMERNFSKWKNDPQWKVWLFHAMKHVNGPNLYGIMFDQKDKQRQGCAAFYQGVGGNTPVKLRDQLYVCVHELGHCFNLFHSFHKRYMNPPVPNRPAALSWMNYPGNYSGGGSSAFWSAFPFQFDNQEIIHLRHAFRNNIVFGGSNFGIGAALEDPQAFSDIIDDQSGLELNIRVDKIFALGEPVVIESKLSLTDTRGKDVHIAKQLDPNIGTLQLAIQKPSGQVYAYEPPIEQCVNIETTSLDIQTQPALYNSTYIGYDKHLGQVFDQPGVYKVRAVYYSLDGSEVLSNIARITVRPPLSVEDQEAAELMLGDDQGMLMQLKGSESPYLKKGNDELETLLEKYPNNILATYAKFAKGVCQAREFKSIDENGTVSVRKANIDQASALLNEVVQSSSKEAGLDNISLKDTMDQLAICQAEQGKKKEAKDTAKQSYTILQKKNLNPIVLNQIKIQTDALINMIDKGMKA